MSVSKKSLVVGFLGALAAAIAVAMLVSREAPEKTTADLTPPEAVLAVKALRSPRFVLNVEAVLNGGLSRELGLRAYHVRYERPSPLLAAAAEAKTVD